MIRKSLRVTLLSTLMISLFVGRGVCGGYEGGAKVTRIYASIGGVVAIMTNSGSETGAPSCSTAGAPYAFAYQVNSTTSATSAPVTALLVSALVTGTTVRLDGTGACSLTGVNEDLLDVYYNN